MTTDLVTETEDANIFNVTSSSSNEDYEVSIIREECDDVSCFLKCAHCGVCSHTYTCSCADALVLNNMCKHIHLTRRKQLERHQCIIPNDQSRGIPVDENYMQQELDVLAKFAKGSRRTDTDRVKEQIASVCEQIRNSVNESSNTDALMQLRLSLTAALNTFISVKEEDSHTNIRLVSTGPANKNVEKQQRFYSIKKKRKGDCTVKFCKPTKVDKRAFDEVPEWMPVFATRDKKVHAIKTEGSEKKQKENINPNALKKQGQ